MISMMCVYFFTRPLGRKGGEGMSFRANNNQFVVSAQDDDDRLSETLPWIGILDVISGTSERRECPSNRLAFESSSLNHTPSLPHGNFLSHSRAGVGMPDVGGEFATPRHSKRTSCFAGR